MQYVQLLVEFLGLGIFVCKVNIKAERYIGNAIQMKWGAVLQLRFLFLNDGKLWCFWEIICLIIYTRQDTCKKALFS